MLVRRILEIMPAFFSWGAIILPVVLSFKYPMVVAIFIVAFSAMWFVRAMEFMGFLLYSFLKYKRSQNINWFKKIDNLEQGVNLPRKDQLKREKLVNNNDFIYPSELIHLVVVATYKEPLEVLKQSINSVANANYNKKNIYLCLATEERDHDRGLEHAKIIKEQYGDVFGRIFHTEHPDGIAGEVRGKGGNITHAGREVSKILQAEGLKFEKVLVTTLDADNCVHQNYFNAMTYNYCLAKKRKHKSFQPISFFFNNIWEVPMMNRLVSIASGFWHMIVNVRPDIVRNFATHSQPLDALAEMDFWSTKTIVEDGHQYWRSYFHFQGDYKVVPVFIPVYQDAMQQETLWKSLKGQFLQLRRWAWGSSDIPFVFLNWWKDKKKLPFWYTLWRAWILCESHFMWATAPILITLTTPVPRLINANFRETVFAENSAYLIGHFFTFALLGLFVAMLVCFLTLPPPPRKIQKFTLLFQWLLLPVVTLFFGSLPSLTAQTILASGKKLEFNVTPKMEKKKLNGFATNQ